MNRFGYMQTATLDPVEVAKQKEAKIILRSSKPPKPHPIYPALSAPAVVAFDKSFIENMTRAKIKETTEKILRRGYHFTEVIQMADILILEHLGTYSSSINELGEDEAKEFKPTLQMVPSNMFFDGWK